MSPLKIFSVLLHLSCGWWTSAQTQNWARTATCNLQNCSWKSNTRQYVPLDFLCEHALGSDRNHCRHAFSTRFCEWPSPDFYHPSRIVLELGVGCCWNSPTLRFSFVKKSHPQLQSFLVHQDGQTLSQTMWPKDCGCEAQMQPMSCPRPANRGPEHPAIPTTQEAWFLLGASYSKFYLRSEHLQKGFNWSHLDTSLDFSKQDPNHVQMKPHATILCIGELTLASTKTSFFLNIGHCIHARQ